jgi:hypothetical protein
MIASRHEAVSVSRPGPLGRGLAVALPCLLLALSAAGARSPFRNSSLFGTFAAVGAGDGHTSSSVGTVTYDGDGNVTRTLVVNAPDGSGGRRLLIFESTGVYQVRPDGTGDVFPDNQNSTRTSTEVTFEFVIQESLPNGKGGQRRATRLFGVQREPGTTVSLVTTTETLIAP